MTVLHSLRFLVVTALLLLSSLSFGQSCQYVMVPPALNYSKACPGSNLGSQESCTSFAQCGGRDQLVACAPIDTGQGKACHTADSCQSQSQQFVKNATFEPTPEHRPIFSEEELGIILDENREIILRCGGSSTCGHSNN
jgi:hypothetical protein